jgi:hypothetical protein
MPARHARAARRRPGARARASRRGLAFIAGRTFDLDELRVEDLEARPSTSIAYRAG